MKEEILDIVQESRENICSLESSIQTIKEEEDNMYKNYKEVCHELDGLIDKQIQLLERKRERLKGDLRSSVTAQKQIFDAQMESFTCSLGCLTSSVEFTEEALNKGSEVNVLSAKSQMIQQLTELNSKTSDLKPRRRIYYKLKAGASLENHDTFEKIAKIKEYDQEFCLGRVHINDRGQITYCIRPQSRGSTFGMTDKVQVKITEPDSDRALFPVVTWNTNGFFSFNYCPGNVRYYSIKVMVNGRYVHGSPFNINAY